MTRSQNCIRYCANECFFGQIQQVEQLAAAQVGYISRDTKFCPAGAAALTQMLALDLGLSPNDPKENQAVTSASNIHGDKAESCVAYTQGPEATTIDGVRTITGEAVLGELLGALPHEQAMRLFPMAVAIEPLPGKQN